jgi:superfamily II DNA or RNA helicase
MNVIEFDNTRAKLHFDGRAAVNAAFDALKYKIPGSEFTPKFKEGHWDGFVSMYNRLNSTFPTGVMFLVVGALREKGLAVSFDDKRDKSRTLPPVGDHSIETILKGFTLRDYQVQAVQAILAHRNGIIQSPTGSGKTLIAAAFIKYCLRHRLRVLFLTNQTELLYQTQAALEKGGMAPTLIGDGLKDFSPLCVGMVQTLFMGLPVSRPGKFTRVDGRKQWQPATSRPGKPEVIAYLNDVDVIVLDEAHGGSSESVQAICNRCVSSQYRIGLTATPLMKTWMDDLRLIAITGDIIKRITLQDLIDRGLLAQPYIKHIRISAPLLNRSLPWSKAYAAGIVNNSLRNAQVEREAVTLAAAGCTVLILVTQVQHGRILQNRLAAYGGLRVKYIHGAKTKGDRDEAIGMLKNKEIDILISSTIVDQGVDIPAVSAVILAGSGKSTIKMYQRIGRGMRPKSGDNSVYIVDFIDLTQRHLTKHSLERFKVVQAEPAFIRVDDFSKILTGKKTRKVGR